jgi:hypothetical protein
MTGTGMQDMSQWPPPQLVVVKRRRHKILIVVLAVLLFSVACYGAANIYALLYPSDAGSTTMNANFNPEWVYEVKTDLEPSASTSFYTNEDEAINHSEAMIEDAGLPLLSSEVFRFETGEALAIYYMGENREGKKGVVGYYFAKRDNRISSLLRTTYVGCKPLQTVPLLVDYDYYDLGDQVSYYVNNQIVLYKTGDFTWANGGKPTYMGVTQDEAVFNLTVSGVAPTEVVTAYIGEEKYYIWYFIGTDFAQILEDSDINWGSYNLNQVTAALDIKY